MVHATSTAFALLIFFLCRHVDVDAATTLSQGQSLEGDEKLLSANGAFSLSFFTPRGGDGSRVYLGVMYAKAAEQTVPWVANRDAPVSAGPVVFRHRDELRPAPGAGGAAGRVADNRVLVLVGGELHADDPRHGKPRARRRRQRHASGAALAELRPPRGHLHPWDEHHAGPARRRRAQQDDVHVVEEPRRPGPGQLHARARPARLGAAQHMARRRRAGRRQEERHVLEVRAVGQDQLRGHPVAAAVRLRLPAHRRPVPEQRRHVLHVPHLQLVAVQVRPPPRRQRDVLPARRRHRRLGGGLVAAHDPMPSLQPVRPQRRVLRRRPLHLPQRLRAEIPSGVWRRVVDAGVREEQAAEVQRGEREHERRRRVRRPPRSEAAGLRRVGVGGEQRGRVQAVVLGQLHVQRVQLQLQHRHRVLDLEPGVGGHLSVPLWSIPQWTRI